MRCRSGENVTSAAAFVEVFIPVVRDRALRLNARTCAPRLHRLVRIGIVRPGLGVLHYLLTEREEETHARTPRLKLEK